MELFAYIAAGLLYETFKSKPCTKLYVISFVICIIGAVGVLTNDEKESPWADLFFDYLSKVGISMAFLGVYQANILFPIVFSSTTFGICAMMGSTASTISIFSIYSIEGKDGYWIFMGLCIVGIVFSLL